MPLRIIELDGNYSKPVIVCGHCGEGITMVADGNYLWRFGARGDYPGAPVYFTHKTCCDAFEQMNRGPWLAMELETLFVFLSYGLKLDWEAAKRRTALQVGLG